MAKRPQTSSYALLKTELDTILAWFDGEQFDLDQAEAKYHRAVEIISVLDKRLRTMKLKVEKIRVDVD